MEKRRSKTAERILDLTLEIIYLLTGENYISFKLSDGFVASNFLKTQSPNIEPPSGSPRQVKKKAQEVTREIIELLTGEVPIRCQDVTVYFSMEEWEYVEGHKDLYKDFMVENRSPFTTPDGSSNRNPPERCPRPLYSWDSTQEHQEISQEDQSEAFIEVVVGEDSYAMGDNPCKVVEVPPEISTDPGGTRAVGAEKELEHVNIRADIPLVISTALYLGCQVKGPEQMCHVDLNLPAAVKMKNTIASLKNFSKLDFQSKLRVISKGRPMPQLADLQQMQGQKKLTRSFQIEWYQRKDWLCGCATTNRLYCFPCLLFSATNSVWTNAGFCDLKNLSRGLNKHERSTTHIECQIDLKTFGTSRIDLALNQQQILNISTHNAKVKENREIVKDLINVTCFLAKQELALRGKDESAMSSSRGDFVKLLHAFAEKDERLAKHLKTSTVFSDLSNKIQNDLFDAVADVIRNDIKKEIDAAPFVAIEVDETTDLTNKAQLCVIMRYVATSGLTCEVKEAFLEFGDVTDRRAPAIASYVFGVLQKYNCVKKLVSQTYDGACVLASDLNRVQAMIKEMVPEATFIHCYAHKLNLVLMHSAKCMPECKTFFKKVEGLATFFKKSTKHTHLLDEVVKRHLLRDALIKWSSNSRLVQTISMYQSEIRAVFQIMSDNPDIWDSETLMMAAGYDLWLSKASTYFLLMVYECIFKETDALFRVLQNKVIEIGLCCSRIRCTMEFVELQRREFDNFYHRFQQKCATLGLKDDDQTKQTIRDERKQMFYNILGNIIVQMKARFDHFGELAFIGFADCTRLVEMSQHFDDIKLQSLSKYARHFDFVRLKVDLIGLYGSSEVKNTCKSPGQLLSFLVQNDLIQTVPEATKLLQLVLTIPATTPSAERSFSALKRLKTYSWNRSTQGQCSSQAIISIETERLLKLKESKEDFYNKVIDIFVQKDRRMDFIYK